MVTTFINRRQHTHHSWITTSLYAVYILSHIIFYFKIISKYNPFNVLKLEKSH